MNLLALAVSAISCAPGGLELYRREKESHYYQTARALNFWVTALASFFQQGKNVRFVDLTLDLLSQGTRNLPDQPNRPAQDLIVVIISLLGL